MGPKLVTVIHAEEEFDWDGGFCRSNTQVTYAKNLIDVIERILTLGGKVTLAMDYPFVTSEGGQQVIRHFEDQVGQSLEFATHLHPWVSPPFETDQDEVDNQFSYPGNLPEALEYQKISLLTDTIESVTGTRPVTYLAGRYGLGAHTQAIIKQLGYQVDLSISAYCDFRHQQGPDFSHYSSRKFQQNGITYLPHTSSILSVVPPLRNYLNRTPSLFNYIQSTRLTHFAGRCLRIKRFRLSPEGFRFREMKQVTEAQLKVGQNEFIMSFHSPSTKPGLTPYTQSDADIQTFTETIREYLTYFIQELHGQTILPASLAETVSKDRGAA